MQNRTWPCLLTCSCAVLIIGGPVFVTPGAEAADESTPIAWSAVVGQPYPDFVLPRIDGNLPLKLSDYRGRKLLLVHFASW